MSKTDLLLSAEKLLESTNDDILKEILKDYVIEKKFNNVLPNLEENKNLLKICEDLDEWQKKHEGAFSELWTPNMKFSSFEKATITYLSSDNDDFMTLNLSKEDYYCGNREHEERRLDILKEWLFINTEFSKDTPWVIFWNKKLMMETQERFEKNISSLFPEQTIDWFYSSIIGVTRLFFESSDDLIMKKIHRFQNLNYFLSKASSLKIKELYPTLINYEIIIDPQDDEFGTTSLISFLVSLESFNPVEINKIIQKIKTEHAQEERNKEKNEKINELKKLQKKYSIKEIEEVEELIKLKKELK